MKPQVCQVCGDDVVFGRLLPTGAICVDCGDVAADVLPGPLAAVAALEPEAPTDNTHQGEGESSAPSATKAPRAAEEQQESKGEPAPRVLAGDRAIDGVVGRPEVATRPAHDAGRSTTLSIEAAPMCGICGCTRLRGHVGSCLTNCTHHDAHGCLRVKGHSGFHTTTPQLAKSEDADPRLGVPPCDHAHDLTKLCPVCYPELAAVASDLAAEKAAVSITAEAFDVEIAHVRAFRAPKTREVPSIEVEEWVYITRTHVPHLSLMERLALLRTPREIFPGQLEEAAGGFEVCRFVVVLEWRMSSDSDITLRDIGPSFQPRMGSRDDRAAALNTATAWARGQAKKLKAVGPMGYRAAREIS